MELMPLVRRMIAGSVVKNLTGPDDVLPMIAEMLRNRDHIGKVRPPPMTVVV